MDLKTSLSSCFASVTFIILAIISVFKYDKLDSVAMFSLMWRTIPAAVVMGFLGRMIGAILDTPRNLADSDYQTDVLKALKQLDKNITMADLQEKLAPIQELPDELEGLIPDEKDSNNGSST